MAKVRTNDPQAALDLAQETMIAVLTALREGRVNSVPNVAAYVHGTARNLINNHLRKRDQATIPLRANSTAADNPERAAERSEELSIVDRALQQLTTEDRQVLRLTLVEGLKPGEIAERLGLSSEVVRKRKSRAKARLKATVRAWSRKHSTNHYRDEGR